MQYYIAKKLDATFDEAIRKTTDALKTEGFGVLTEIDVKETLKKKLDVDFRNYRILGACNPPFAHKALQIEEYVGAMLPCNVVVQEREEGVEVAAVDPVASMQAIGNEKLAEIAGEIRDKLRKVVEAL
jgi:uncharacterized protein (DUF302 family)